MRPIAASNCDLDTAIVRGDAPLPGPFAIGHEFVAEILEVGDEVASFAHGDVVIVPWKISCGTCAACLRGVTAGCTAVPPLAMFGLPIGGAWGSALADAVRVPFAEQMLVALPQAASPIVLASASDNLPDAWRCVAPYLSQQPGADVLILGGGTRSTGLFAAGSRRPSAPSEPITSTATPPAWRSQRPTAPTRSRLASRPSGSAPTRSWSTPARHLKDCAAHFARPPSEATALALASTSRSSPFRCSTCISRASRTTQDPARPDHSFLPCWS